MQFYKFKSKKKAKKLGFTTDPEGANLPAVLAPWEAAGTINLRPGDGPKTGDNSTAIIAGVERDGYFVYPSA